MSRYRKIDVRIWNDARFIRLDDDAKLAFLCVLTHPHMTSLGAMRASVPGLAAELGWTTERFRDAFAKLAGTAGNNNHRLVDYDEQVSFVGLPNFLKYNEPENPNLVKSWGSQLDLLPECDAKTRLLERVESCVTERGEAFVQAWETVCQTVSGTVSEGFPEPSQKGSEDSTADSGKGMPNPEPEQEPEPKPEQKLEPNKKDAADAAGGSSTSLKRTSKSQEPSVIPSELDTESARKALDDFKEHRRQLKKPLTAMAEAKLLKEWSSKGAGRFVAAVDHSIANGWQGVFEAEYGAVKKASRIEPPAGKYDDESDIVDLTKGGQDI